MSVAVAELPWLPRVPADFRQRCKSLDVGDEGLGDALRQLANHYLEAGAAQSLARAIVRLRAAGADLSPLKPVKLGLLSNANMDLAIAGLVAAGVRHGFLVDAVAADYGQHYHAAVDPASALHRARPDIVLLALDHRAFNLDVPLGDSAAADAALAGALKLMADIRTGIRINCGAGVILQTLAAPTASLFGSHDLRVAGTLRYMVSALNRALLESAMGAGEVVLDVAHIASMMGLASWFDAKHWNVGKIPFSPDYIPLYCDHVGRLLAAIAGKARKALVLDLDNTLWGGVIGDDGLEGIVIGQGTPVGEAHLAVQQAALELHRRGIVLAVSSKNDDRVARQPFRTHPDMLLKEHHISVFQANWEDKARNLRAIAETLSIGLDALVFLDDNPLERGLVRRELPMVAVPELPEDASSIAGTLMSAGYFDAIQFTEDDRTRNRNYADNARRAQFLSAASDVESYLRALDMVLEFGAFDPINRARVAQLINKTNQWNLTTRRYTESMVKTFEAAPAAFTLHARLRDSFGDNGIIAVAIALAEAEEWRIDTWLMSCRVLNRQVEFAILNRIAAAARAAGALALVGEFIPSGRNEMVRDLYGRLGFEPAGEQDNVVRWRLELAAFKPFDIPMTLTERADNVQDAGR